MGRRSRTPRSLAPQERPAAPRTPHRRSRRRWIVALLAAVGGLAGVVWALARDGAPPVSSYEVVNVFPHDANAYCQGLVYADDVLYESTGQYGASSLRKVELETGKLLKYAPLERRLFGEGLTLWNDQLIQLTWRNELALFYDKQTFAEQQRVEYTGQGWGLTHDGKQLILSDGSSVLRFLDPATFEVVRRLRVRSRGRSVEELNELEYVQDRILANIWHQDYIACISPESGEVVEWIDLRNLWPARNRRSREDVLNGIAYDAEHDRLFVTGKNWPRLFEIRLRPSR